MSMGAGVGVLTCCFIRRRGHVEVLWGRDRRGFFREPIKGGNLTMQPTFSRAALYLVALCIMVGTY